MYGQPSWWGDGDADDENSFKQENKAAGKKQETLGTGEASVPFSYIAYGIVSGLSCTKKHHRIIHKCSFRLLYLKLSYNLFVVYNLQNEWLRIEIIILGGHNGTASSNATLQLQGPWFDPGLRALSVRSPVCASFLYPCGFLMGSPVSPILQIHVGRWLGYSRVCIYPNQGKVKMNE